MRAEHAAGDTTCGDHGGELGHWLQLQIVRTGGASGDQRLWSGSLSDLAQGVDLLSDVAAGDAPDLRLVTSLPLAATNETMSDGVTYDLLWTYAGVAGATDTSVLAVHQAAGGGPGGSSFGLPGTGNPISSGLLAVIAVLITGGGVLMGRGRRRAQRAPSTS
jgi:LPXTG-motif cell wall-anchored protein